METASWWRKKVLQEFLEITLLNDLTCQLLCIRNKHKERVKIYEEGINDKKKGKLSF